MASRLQATTSRPPRDPRVDGEALQLLASVLDKGGYVHLCKGKHTAQVEAGCSMSGLHGMAITVLISMSWVAMDSGEEGIYGFLPNFPITNSCSLRSCLPHVIGHVVEVSIHVYQDSTQGTAYSGSLDLQLSDNGGQVQAVQLVEGGHY